MLKRQQTQYISLKFLDPQYLVHENGASYRTGDYEMYFEKYLENGQFRWRLRAGNHEIIASGESYVNEAGCDNAVNLVKSTNTSTPVYRR